MDTKRIERLLVVVIVILLVNIVVSFKQYRFVSQDLGNNIMFVYKCNVYTGNVTLTYPSQEFLEQHRVKSER
jgi:hypothetical protein